MLHDKLTLSQWLSLCDESNHPGSLLTRVLTSDPALMHGAPQEISRWVFSGKSLHVFFGIWSLLDAEERREVAGKLAHALLHWGDEVEFGCSLEQISSTSLLSDDDFQPLLEHVINHLYDCLIGVQLDEVSPFATRETRIFRLLQVLGKRTCVFSKFDLDPLFYGVFPGDRSLRGEAANIKHCETSGNWPTRLALWHYIVFVCEPRSFIDLLIEEFVALDKVLDVGVGSAHIAPLQSALSGYCPPFELMLKYSFNPAQNFRSLGGLILAFDLWLLSRFNHVAPHSEVFAALSSAYVSSIGKHLLALTSCNEPIVAAMAGGVISAYRPTDYSPAVCVERLRQQKQPRREISMDVLSMAMGGESGVVEILALIEQVSLTSQVSDILFDTLAIIPGWRGSAVDSKLSSLGCRLGTPRKLGEKCASAQLVGLSELTSNKENYILELLENGVSRGAQDTDYCKTLAQELLVSLRLAVPLLCECLKGARSGIAALILRLGGDFFIDRLDPSSRGLLRDALENAISQSQEVRTRLKLLESMSAKSGAKLLDSAFLLKLVMEDQNEEIRERAASLIGNCPLPLGVSEAMIRQLDYYFEHSPPKSGLALACSYLPHLDSIRDRDRHLAEAIVKKIIDSSLLPDVPQSNRVELLLLALKAMEALARGSDSSSLSSVHSLFLAMIAAV